MNAKCNQAHRKVIALVSLLVLLTMAIPLNAFAEPAPIQKLFWNTDSAGLVTGSLQPMGRYFPAIEPSFSNALFKTKWQRADKPITDGVANPSRSWLWGPESFSPSTGNSESYLESPGGSRTVLYFDKARMELNNPATGLVTNGLLVRELISGRLATGDSAFTQLQTATDIPIAGDPQNNNGPTYSSFGKVATTDNDNPSSDRTGQAVADTITRDGAIGTNPDLGGYSKYAYFENTLKHNIPEVFWNFLNQRGNVYVNGQLQNNQPVLGDNPNAPWLDATGFPITEAYWATVTVAGQSKLVLTQAYERRVLTYTPDNPVAFKVEMGNVGRHYFNWRYDNKYDLPIPAGGLAKVTGKITFWHAYGDGGSGEPAALDKALEAFKKDNPEATVEVIDVPFADLFKKYETDVASGRGPDLFIAPNDSMGKEARAGLLAPLDEALKGKLENVLTVALEGAKVNGKLYMVPESLKAVALFYNKDRIKTPPKTIDEMLAAQKAGTVKFGFNSNIYHVFGFTGAFGGKLLDNNGKCVADQGGFAEAFKFMQDMKAAGAQLITHDTNASNAFQNGSIDAIIEGPWKTADYKDAYGDKLGVAAIPAGPKGAANPMVGVDGWYINPNLTGTRLDNAVNFALYLTSPKIEQYFIDLSGHIPANSNLKITDPITQGFAVAVATGYPRPLVPEMDNFWGPFGTAYSNVTELGADAVASVKEACAKMNVANGK